jgi:peptide-methionine (R)-S-oxide reductase
MSKYIFVAILSVFLLSYSSCQSKKGNNLKSGQATMVNGDYFINMYRDTIRKVIKSEDEWKKVLSEKEFYVLRQKGTERAFTSDLLNIKMVGLYTCKGCGMPLFASKHKFDSGTGWPSFFDIPDKSAIHTDTDYDLGYPRTELTCSKCGGHLGHVFDDGPKPTGKRYCINGVSLTFVKAEN